MLKVIIEVHPGGNSEKAKTIGWAEIFNIDDRPEDDKATYQAVLYMGERGQGKVIGTGQAKDVKKSRGAWFVVYRALFQSLIKTGRKGSEKYVDR